MNFHPLEFRRGNVVRVVNPLPENRDWENRHASVEGRTSRYGALAYEVKVLPELRESRVLYALELEPVAPKTEAPALTEEVAQNRADLSARLEEYWRHEYVPPTVTNAAIGGAGAVLLEDCPSPDHEPPTGEELPAMPETRIGGQPPAENEPPANNEQPVVAAPLSRGEKIKATMERQAAEQGITIGEMMRQRRRPSKPGQAQQKTEAPTPSPENSGLSLGDHVRVLVNVGGELLQEDQLVAGTTVEIHELRIAQARVYDPSNPLRGLADAEEGIAGWWVRREQLEPVPGGTS